MTRDKYLQKQYGITEAEYERLLAEYSGTCWICGKAPKEGGRRLHLEHDHKTKRIRGIACWHCNTMLQRASDDPAKLRAAAAYLENDLAEQILRRMRSGR